MAAVILLLTGCGGGTSAELTGYRTGLDDREITVSYLRGEHDAPGHLTIVEQGPDQVRVRVLHHASDDTNQTLIGVVGEAVGRLSEPLGDRAVLDEDGDSVRPLS